MAGLKRGFEALWLALLFSALSAWADAPPAAPAMLLAETFVLEDSDAPRPPAQTEAYATDIDVSHYWVSEKFDGVRAQWDGHTLRFRSGGSVPAPAWFTAHFPAVPLDGELWAGRNQFDALSSTVRKIDPVESEWRQVRYLVFELPGAAGDFSTRIAQMQAHVAQANVPWLRVVEQTRVANSAELKRRMEAIVEAGGEGLMLHRADAPYVTGRNNALLKLKPWQDTEATVIGHIPGKGKYQGMTGALQMEMPNGKRFRIGSGLTDTLRRQPPPIGTRITYRYQHLTKNGLPRFPRYLRVRENF